VLLLLYAAYLNYLTLDRRADTLCLRVKFLLQVLLPANVLNISLLGGFVWTVFFVAAVLTVPFATYYLFLTHWEVNVIAWLLAGVFMVLTTLISLREIVGHLVHYNSPRLQKQIVRILWMPIIYSWNSFFEMRYLSNGVYLDAIRQAYEAFVVWSFQVCALCVCLCGVCACVRAHVHALVRLCYCVRLCACRLSPGALLRGSLPTSCSHVLLEVVWLLHVCNAAHTTVTTTPP
jgi:hypothetical protein